MRETEPYHDEGRMLATNNLEDVPLRSPGHDAIAGEASEIEILLESVELPFEHPYLNLAFELYESSLRTSSKNMGFVLLMNGMEVLLGPGDMEPRYSTSRNAAVLLATPEDLPEDIFKRMMGLFKKRSLLFFGQSEAKRSRKIDEEDVKYLKSLLVRGIVRAHRLGFDKAGLLHLLNRSKF